MLVRRAARTAPRPPARVVLPALPRARLAPLPLLARLPLRALFALLTCVTGLTPAPAAAQDFTVYALTGRSDNAEIAESDGFGGSAAFPIEPWLRVRVGLDVREGSHSRVGFTCLRIQPNVNCQGGATIASQSRLEAVSATAMPTWQPLDALRLSAGVGVSVGRTRIEAADAEGRPALHFAPKTGHLGLALVSELRLRPLAAVPLEVVGAWQGRLMSLDGCVVSDDTYSPFCGRTWFSDLQIGVGVAL